MTRILATVLAISMCHPAPAQNPNPNQTLASFVDRNRVLLVFAPTARDSRLAEQLTLLRPHAAETKDRDLIVVPIPAQSNPPAIGTLTAAEQLAARQRFGIGPSDFSVILLGKDGGEKLRSAAPVAIERLNRTIDAMPMRRQEMRERKPK